MLDRLPAPHLPPPLAELIGRVVSRLPPLATRVLTVVPPSIEQPVIERALNRALGTSLEAGEFDFLKGRTVAIQIDDTDWSITLCGGKDGRLRVLDAPDAETRIRTTAMDFLGLAAGHVDPDTLFFQRRLRIEGNVALGLEVKNTLDSVDRAGLPPELRAALHLARTWFASRDRRLYEDRQRRTVRAGARS